MKCTNFDRCKLSEVFLVESACALFKNTSGHKVCDEQIAQSGELWQVAQTVPCRRCEQSENNENKQNLSGVSFDTNGLNKGLNTWGRDIFFFNMTRQNGLTVLVPDLLKYDSPYGSVEDVLDGTEKWSNCTMQNESAGTQCASKPLLKGKMD